MPKNRLMILQIGSVCITNNTVIIHKFINNSLSYNLYNTTQEEAE